jgi:hypothetical protein
MTSAPKSTEGTRQDGPFGLVVALLVVTGAIVLFLSRNWLAIGLWAIGAVLAIVYFVRAATSGGAPPSDQDSARASRSRAIGYSLIALVVMFYIATMTHLKGNALNKPSPYVQQPVKVIKPADLPKPQGG